jgi:uncharacterized protein involved in cysteine biosynthesis
MNKNNFRLVFSRVRGMGVNAQGHLFSVGVGAEISFAIPLIAIAFPFYVIGVAIHLKSIFGKHAPKPTQWDGDQVRLDYSMT